MFCWRLDKSKKSVREKCSGGGETSGEFAPNPLSDYVSRGGGGAFEHLSFDMTTTLTNLGRGKVEVSACNRRMIVPTSTGFHVASL